MRWAREIRLLLAYLGAPRMAACMGSCPGLCRLTHLVGHLGPKSLAFEVLHPPRCAWEPPGCLLMAQAEMGICSSCKSREVQQDGLLEMHGSCFWPAVACKEPVTQMFLLLAGS